MTDIVELYNDLTDTTLEIVENSVVDTVEILSAESADVVEILSAGIIPGPRGIDGLPGVDAVGAIPGDVTGDFLRWNEAENAWEVKSEPIEFNQIVLTPSVVAVLNKEGGLWYDSVNKSVMVCTDI